MPKIEVKKKKIEIKVGAGFIGSLVEVKDKYLEGKNLILILTNGQKLVVDLSEYIGDLTDDTKVAIENMKIEIVDGKLLIDFDDEVLQLDFYKEGNDLVVDNNVEDVDFNINENKELEVSY